MTPSKLKRFVGLFLLAVTFVNPAVLARSCPAGSGAAEVPNAGPPGGPALASILVCPD